VVKGNKKTDSGRHQPGVTGRPALDKIRWSLMGNSHGQPDGGWNGLGMVMGLGFVVSFG